MGRSHYADFVCARTWLVAGEDVLAQVKPGISSIHLHPTPPNFAAHYILAMRTRSGPARPRSPLPRADSQNPASPPPRVLVPATPTPASPTLSASNQVRPLTPRSYAQVVLGMRLDIPDATPPTPTIRAVDEGASPRSVSPLPQNLTLPPPGISGGPQGQMVCDSLMCPWHG